MIGRSWNVFFTFLPPFFDYGIILTFIHSFILFDYFLLSNYYVSDTVLGSKNLMKRQLQSFKFIEDENVRNTPNEYV